MQVTEFLEGQPCWLELRTSDPGRAKEFYTALLEWGFEDRDGETVAQIHSSPVASIVPAQDSDGPDEWITYLRVDDLDSALEKVQENGGHVIEEASERPGLGRVALVSEGSQDDAIRTGLLQSAPEGGGYGSYFEPGAPYWHELYSRHFRDTADFYRETFGSHSDNVSDIVGFNYLNMLGPDGGAVAGLMDASDKLPDGVPGHWRVYWGVDDALARKETVNYLGGDIPGRPVDTHVGSVVTVIGPGQERFLIASGYPAVL